MKIEKASVTVSTTEKSEIKWPAWKPSTFKNEIADIDQRFLPSFIKMPSGEVVTYGRRPDGTEQIVIVSKREENAKDGIFQFRQCFLPTSYFAGKSPLLPHTNELLSHDPRTRPTWLKGKRVLMGTSAGTFGMPAEALMNPGWDALIFVSGGTNLLSLYESGSAGLFADSLNWISDARHDPPMEVTRIFTEQEYHEIYCRSATMTKFHSGKLASFVRDPRILMIAGSIDHIMPDQQALGLHRALGRPERWTAPLGHHLIAVQLVLEVDRIDRWIMAPTTAKPNP